MPDARIAIVGAGLAGLYAAHLLEQQDVRDHVLLEARDVPGGRIASPSGPTAASVGFDMGHFDLGPSWFWPGFQQQLGRLVQELELDCFPQFETGDMLMERSPGEPPRRMQGLANAPPSMRLMGGMRTLTNALRHRLTMTPIVTGLAVRRLRATATHIELDCEVAGDRGVTWRVEQVLLAIPPRLATHQLEFAPGLPPTLARQWRDTPTWMAPHAKYLAVYDMPFWREEGLSGEARSALGPLGEIHDASMPGGGAALFGFFGVPAQARARVSDAELRRHCRVQLARLFGPKAEAPGADLIKDWAQDPYTATIADQVAGGDHVLPPAITPDAGPWASRLIGIASEWSPRFPGYLAGAIEAAGLGVEALSASICRG